MTSARVGSVACRGGGSGSFVSLRYVTFITLYVYVIFDVDLKAMFMLFYVYDVYLIMLQEVVPRVKHNVLLHHSYIILLYLCYSCSFSDRFTYRLSMRNKHSGMKKWVLYWFRSYISVGLLKKQIPKKANLTFDDL